MVKQHFQKHYILWFHKINIWEQLIIDGLYGGDTVGITSGHGEEVSLKFNWH